MKKMVYNILLKVFIVFILILLLMYESSSDISYLYATF